MKMVNCPSWVFAAGKAACLHVYLHIYMAVEALLVCLADLKPLWRPIGRFQVKRPWGLMSRSGRAGSSDKNRPGGRIRAAEGAWPSLEAESIVGWGPREPPRGVRRG